MDVARRAFPVGAFPATKERSIASVCQWSLLEALFISRHYALNMDTMLSSFTGYTSHIFPRPRRALLCCKNCPSSCRKFRTLLTSPQLQEMCLTAIVKNQNELTEDPGYLGHGK